MTHDALGSHFEASVSPIFSPRYLVRKWHSDYENMMRGAVCYKENLLVPRERTSKVRVRG